MAQNKYQGQPLPGLRMWDCEYKAGEEHIAEWVIEKPSFWLGYSILGRGGTLSIWQEQGDLVGDKETIGRGDITPAFRTFPEPGHVQCRLIAETNARSWCFYYPNRPYFIHTSPQEDAKIIELDGLTIYVTEDLNAVER